MLTDKLVPAALHPIKSFPFSSPERGRERENLLQGKDWTDCISLAT